MSDAPERKADLDKDGIAFDDAGKAELDKDGISFATEETTGPEESPKTVPDATGEPAGKKRLSLTVLLEKLRSLDLKKNKRLTLALIGGGVGLVLLLSFGVYALFHTDTPVKQAAAAPPKVDSVYGQDDGMVLDPFMVFSDTHVPRATGVVIAQVSLKVDPEVVSTVESRLFDIRSIIFKRLVSAANVYTEAEIAEMLSKDLEDFHVRQATFIQYQTR